MKRLFGVAVLCAFLVCCGCQISSVNQKTEPQKAFSRHIKGNSGSFCFEGELTVNAEQDISIVFSSPEGIAGFKIKLGEDGFYADVLGVEDFTPLSQISDNSLIKMVLVCVRQAVFYQHDFVPLGEKNSSATFTQCQKQFSVRYDENGFLTDIECKQAELFCAITP